MFPVGCSSRNFRRMLAGASAGFLFSAADRLPAQAPSSPPLPNAVVSPADAAAQQAPAPGDVGGGSNDPTILDGLESLKLAQDPVFDPPIVDSSELFLGQPPGGASTQSKGDYMRPLEANLSLPDLTAPSFQPGLELSPLIAPEKVAMLEFPDTFGPSTGGLTRDILSPLPQNRPLGTIGAPSFMSTKRSFTIGNSRVRYGVAINAAVAYNNNVFGSPKNPQGDAILTLQPTFYLETGKKGTVQFLWSPSVLRYAKYKELNAVNQTFAFSSRYRWSKLRVGLDASYLAQSGLFLNSQGQSQQKAVFTRLFAGYALTKKTEALFSLDGIMTDSGSGGRQFQGTFNASIDYRYSRKTTVGAAVALGYNISTAGTTTSESFLLRLLYNPTSKLVFRGEGGLQFRQSILANGGSSSAVTSVVNLSILYRPTSKTYVSLRFFRNVDMDAFSAGNLQITTSLETAASWKISNSTTLNGSLAVGRVENVSLSGADTGNYNYAQANLALSYLLTDDVNLNLFNNLQQKLNDTQGNNYLSNTSGMSLGMRF